MKTLKVKAVTPAAAPPKAGELLYILRDFLEIKGQLEASKIDRFLTALARQVAPQGSVHPLAAFRIGETMIVYNGGPLPEECWVFSSLEDRFLKSRLPLKD